MPQMPHGATVLIESFDAATENPAANEDATTGTTNTPSSTDWTRFDYLLPDHDDPACLLPTPTVAGANPTVANLIRLGCTMVDPNPDDTAYDSNIPSAYTYFAQFIDHDIALEQATKDIDLSKSNLVPWSAVEIEKKVKNLRSATLDLDSVYSPALHKGVLYPVPRAGDKMVIERAVGNGANIGPLDSDLPREKRNATSPDG